jgi:hypothetical protein
MGDRRELFAIEWTNRLGCKGLMAANHRGYVGQLLIFDTVEAAQDQYESYWQSELSYRVVRFVESYE